MPLAVRPLHPLFAAEVTGLDLRDAAGRRPAARESRRRWTSMPSPVLPGQFIDDAQQLRFAGIFGDLEFAPAVAGGRASPAPRIASSIPTSSTCRTSTLRGKLLPPGTSGAAIQPWQPAVAHRQLVPAAFGDLFDAVGADRAGGRRRYRICRHARGLRRAGAGDEGAAGRPHRRALDLGVADRVGLYADRGRARGTAAGPPSRWCGCIRDHGAAASTSPRTSPTSSAGPRPTGARSLPSSWNSRPRGASSIPTSGAPAISSSGTIAAPCTGRRPMRIWRARATCAARRCARRRRFRPEPAIPRQPGCQHSAAIPP